VEFLIPKAVFITIRGLLINDDGAAGMIKSFATKDLELRFCAVRLRTWTLIPLLTFISYFSWPLAAQLSPVACERAIKEKGIGKGNLFSALSVEKSFRAKWEKIYPEAVKKFNLLEFNHPQDLHITVFYIGSDWKMNLIDKLKPLLQISPTAASVDSGVQLSEMSDGKIIALRIVDFPHSWKEAIEKTNRVLNEMGLKRPDRWDNDFEAHISLAEARKSIPSEGERSQLDAFRKWIDEQMHIKSLRISLSPSPANTLFLSNVSRTSGTKYITLDDFIRTNCSSQLESPN
jgi:hypothetical protein